MLGHKLIDSVSSLYLWHGKRARRFRLSHSAICGTFKYDRTMSLRSTVCFDMVHSWRSIKLYNLRISVNVGLALQRYICIPSTHTQDKTIGYVKSLRTRLEYKSTPNCSRNTFPLFIYNFIWQAKSWKEGQFNVTLCPSETAKSGSPMKFRSHCFGVWSVKRAENAVRFRT
jgi:hypothetical protein